MKLGLNLPINSVSFGQTSTAFLRTLFEREKAGDTQYDWYLFPIGQPDLSAQKDDREFGAWIQAKINRAYEGYTRDIPVFKLWHLNGSLESVAKNQTLLTFYELDNPTKIELNIARNNKVCFSSKYNQEIFKNFGIDSQYIPLFFEYSTFSLI